MGCGASTENNAPEKGNTSKQQGTGAKNDVAKSQNLNESIKFQNANNLVVNSNNKSSDGNFISPNESCEIIIQKPSKPRNPEGKKNSMNSYDRKSKELKQVEAWGKKSCTTETNFLEDLRTQRRKSNAFYEQEYETSEVDETSRFIKCGDQDSGMIIDDESISEISDSSNQVLNISKETDHEECFDVSKIIDVEKFRAANVNGERRDESVNEVGSNIKLLGETEKVNSSDEDVEKTSNEDLYNEDDKHLIESIEKEFLITQDNFLPGQIVN